MSGVRIMPVFAVKSGAVFSTPGTGFRNDSLKFAEVNAEYANVKGDIDATDSYLPTDQVERIQKSIALLSLLRARSRFSADTDTSCTRPSGQIAKASAVSRP